MLTLFNYLLIFNVFGGAFVIFYKPFDFCTGYIFIILFLIFYVFKYRNLSVNRNFLIILAILTLSSLFNAYCKNVTLFLLLKQAIGIFLTGSAFYLLIKANNYDIDKLFRIYLLFAVLVAIIGVFQEASFLTGFARGYDYSWFIQKWKVDVAKGGMLRVNSFFSEPTHLVVTMAPALFVSLLNILKNNSAYLNKLRSLVIVICCILTFSPILYIALLTSLLLIYPSQKKIKYILIALVMSILVCIGYYYVPEIHMRISDIIKVITGSLPLTKSHLTVYAYASNAFIAFKSFLSNPFFGHGLGSHPLSYDILIQPGASNALWQVGYSGVNRLDANCLFLRLLSETGLFGLVVVFYFIFRFHIKVQNNNNLKILSKSIFVFFIIQLLRQGHYFYNGVFFFVWLYYFAYKINDNSVPIKGNNR